MIQVMNILASLWIVLLVLIRIKGEVLSCVIIGFDFDQQGYVRGDRSVEKYQNRHGREPEFAQEHLK